jgi:hypothetical protein
VDANTTNETPAPTNNRRSVMALPSVISAQQRENEGSAN